MTRDQTDKSGTEETIVLSIVVPVYNRAELVGRCLTSCLQSDDPRYELVLIDDASTDATYDVLMSYAGKHVRIFRQDINGGVSAARQRGVEAAWGHWIAFVDSDDTLMPGAIDALLNAIADAPETIDALYHRERHSYGAISPVIVPKYGEIDYADYIAMMNANLHTDREIFQCMRASALKQVPWPLNRAPETEFHLAFMKRFRILMCPDILYFHYHDAPTRLSLSPVHADPKSLSEQHRLESLERIVETHGDGLRAYGPEWWRHMIANLLSLEFIFGRREAAFRLFRLGWVNGGDRIQLFVILLIGLMGPKIMARLRFIFKIIRHFMMQRGSVSLLRK